ncbi:hypothetical protein EJ08DRAFT_734295 [Tothia fuscella]|uniref:Uncharacterized protein n=1 Tax=Tothia fuscella TaxID=1048955 RepID=A0A9P4NRD5_9PEZI|nr:hypothetical protein EJ08DRAFT_734295 [Tothia fuscella]
MGVGIEARALMRNFFWWRLARRTTARHHRHIIILIMAAFSRGNAVCFSQSYTLRIPPPRVSNRQFILPLQQLVQFASTASRSQQKSEPSKQPPNQNKPPNLTTASKPPSISTPLPPPKQTYTSPQSPPRKPTLPSAPPSLAGATHITSTVRNKRLIGLPPSSLSPNTIHTLLTVPERIYQAPPKLLNTHILSSYTLSSFFFLYGASQFHLVMAPPAGLHWSIPYMYTGGLVALMGVSCYVFMRSTHLVRSLTLIPNHTSRSCTLQIELSKWAPWRRHTITTPLGNAHFTHSVLDSVLSAPETGAKTPLRDVNLFIRPWVWMGRGILGWFRGTRGMFLREYMVGLVVEGEGRVRRRKYEVDVRGMALGGPEGLDRLIRTERQAPVFANWVGK